LEAKNGQGDSQSPVLGWVYPDHRGPVDRFQGIPPGRLATPGRLAPARTPGRALLGQPRVGLGLNHHRGDHRPRRPRPRLRMREGKHGGIMNKHRVGRSEGSGRLLQTSSPQPDKSKDQIY